MSRIGTVFSELANKGKKALIPFITAGDPSPADTVYFMNTLVESGADIIELGVPFSDPMADGPTVQAANERALEHNVSLTDVLKIVEKFRNNNDQTPVVLMGYLNPVEIMGYSKFAKSAAKVGVDGVLIVDCPPEESKEIRKELSNEQLDMIFLASPTSSRQRIELINEVTSGFLYFVSLKGVTGSTALDTNVVKTNVDRIKKITNTPIAVGFGISDAKTAAAVSKVADAVVVGSALVRLIEVNVGDIKQASKAMGQLLKSMRTSIDKIGSH